MHFSYGYRKHTHTDIQTHTHSHTIITIKEKNLQVAERVQKEPTGHFKCSPTPPPSSAFSVCISDFVFVSCSVSFSVPIPVCSFVSFMKLLPFAQFVHLAACPKDFVPLCVVLPRARGPATMASVVQKGLTLTHNLCSTQAGQRGGAGCLLLPATRQRVIIIVCLA